MDFKKLYEDNNSSVLHRPYIYDSESQEYAWDFDSMKDNIHNSPAEYWDEEYRDIDDFDSLKGWWDHHYDPKGMAMSSEYHHSLMDDVHEMMKDYNQHEKDGLVFNFDTIQETENDGNFSVTLKLEGEAKYGNQYCTDEEIIEENVLYYLRSAPIAEAHYDPAAQTFTISWSGDALSSGAF